MLNISPFIIGILSSISATILTSIVWYMMNIIKNYNPLSILIKLDSKKKVNIYYGSIYHELQNNSQINHEKGLTTFEIGDIEATMIVYKCFNKLTKKEISHQVGNEKNYIKDSNIVSVGGPKWNKVTESLIGKLGSPFYFTSTKIGLLEKRKSHTTENIYNLDVTISASNIKTIKTYGFIIIAKSYFMNNVPSAVVIAGLSTYGNLISARYLSTLKKREAKFLKKRLKHDKRIGLMIEGKVEIDTNGTILDTPNIKLLSWIPENDFLEPYDYNYQ